MSKKFDLLRAGAGLALGASLVLHPGLAADAAPRSAAEIRPLLIGTEVPAVRVRTAEDRPLDLREALRGKPTILIFYRGGW